MLFPQFSHASSNLVGKTLICESLDGRMIGIEFLESKVSILYVDQVGDRSAIYGLSKEYSTTYDEVKIGIASIRMRKYFKDQYLLKINRHDLAFMVKTDPEDWEVRDFEELKNLIGNKGSCRVTDKLGYELRDHYKKEKKKQRRML